VHDVLIVDDEAAQRRLLRRCIDREGISIVEAGSAEEALAIAADTPPKVAFCDVDLPPGSNGFWLASEFHALHPTTVVVIVTSKEGVDAVVTGVRAGVKVYLVKPVAPDRVRETLKAALAEHEARVREGGTS
jgi:two-component system KDP operon response regulator KdpE